MIFVFGSNLAGIHGAGAALQAVKEYGAIYGQGIGRQGSSYGIPTKGHGIQTLPLGKIREHVLDFLSYAREHGDEEFFVTRIGCGLAGYKDEDIAPMFVDAPSNCDLPWNWEAAIMTLKEYHYV